MSAPNITGQITLSELFVISSYFRMGPLIYIVKIEGIRHIQLNENQYILS